MNENKQGRLSEEEEKYLRFLEVTPELEAEVISLAREDLEHGLTKEQVQKYVKRGGGFQSMKLYSQCLRNGYTEDVIEVLLKDPDVNRCKLAVEFYEREIPFDGIIKSMDETRNAREMQLLLQELLKQKEALSEQKHSREVPPYAKELIARIQELVGQICVQEDMYGELKRAVSILEASKKDEAEIERLQMEIQNRDMLISSQQDELNKGHKKVAQQRADIEKMEKEMESMKETIAALEERLQEKEETMKAMNGKAVESSGVPVYYSVPVMDRGKVVGRVQVEHTKRHSSAPQSIFAKLFGVFVPGKDIVKKVIDAGLDEQQLAQIRSAMEKGLTETQMNRIINPALSPQKMKEIIDLAVLVNQNQ